MKRLSVRFSVFFVSLAAAVLIFPAMAFAATFPVAVDSTNFPDAAWRAYVNTNYAGGDNILTQTEAEAVAAVNVPFRGIGDLTGIQFFTNITSLKCEINSLTSLDVTGLTNLQILSCYGNSLTSLDVTGLANLRELRCFGNYLTSLDLRSLTNLYYLDCCENTLSSLNVAGLTHIQYFACYDNLLTSLDVTGHTSLQSLLCYRNALIDVQGFSVGLLNATGQIRPIPMIIDPSGGFISESTYTFSPDHAISNMGAGVTFGTDNRFHANTFIGTSTFSTDLTGGWSLGGRLDFELATHTVTFLDWDGTQLGTDTVITGTSATPPADPVREGYRFIGWDSDGTNITEDAVITALYEAIPAPSPLLTPTEQSAGALASTGDTVLPIFLAFVGLLSAGAVLAAARKKLIVNTSEK